MKIALLAAASSIHTVRWANGLSRAGNEVHVISQHSIEDPYDVAVHIHLLPFHGGLGYFTMASSVRKLLRDIQPDIINAHYASGYGTTARLVDYHPFILSVWGSDVYEFPFKSPFHRWLVKKNLRAADQVASTSYCMADQARMFAPELADIAVTPFGVEMSSYEGIEAVSVGVRTKLVIGTVKTMKPHYGIDTLIEAFALLLKRMEQRGASGKPELELRLVGGGDQTSELRSLVKRLGIDNQVSFVGPVPHSEVPKELDKLDIFVALSRQESFGVAVIEASAAGRPVVVSDAGGLSEVTKEGVTGFVVPRENPNAAAVALEKLVLNASLRHVMGVAGQEYVRKKFSWDTCVKTMLNAYRQTIEQVNRS